MVTKKKAFGGFHIVPDEHLAKVIGKGNVSPSEMTKKLWAYVKKNKLSRK
jgi:chromatin remodeling complex protein RSC6